MIQLVLSMLVNQLSGYIRQRSTVKIDGEPVVLGNIALSESLGGNESYMQGKIVLSLVNTIEEASLKNANPYNISDGKPQLTNPPVYLNLFLLILANFTKGGSAIDDTEYSNSLTRLSQVIEFFQGKNVFTVQNSPDGNTVQDPDLQDLRIKLELVSMTFEQINYLWGSLGGKQIPFVLYKAGIVPIQREFITERGELIQDIMSDFTHVKQTP